MRLSILLLALISCPVAATAAVIPVRRPIGSFSLEPSKSITRVELTHVHVLPGQTMPEHMHPVPVICFVTEGAFLVSIGTSPIRRVGVGETTLEPAGTVVHYFRNLSKGSTQLNCAFLAGPDDKTLSVMLRQTSQQCRPKRG